MINRHLIPQEWRSTMLDEFCTFTQGIQIPHSEQINEIRDGYIRYLYIRDYFTDSSPCYIPNEYPHKIMNEQDIMMVNTGNTSGTVYTGKYGVLSNNAFKIGFDSDFIDRDYIFQFLRSNFLMKNLKSLYNHGGQPHVGHKNIAKVPIDLPPLPEQQKIAEILSTLDDKIDVIDQQISETQALKKGLMQRLLTKGIGHTEFKDSPMGEIPKSWEVKTISKVANINKDSLSNTTNNDYEFYYIDLSSVKNGKIEFPESKVNYVNSPSRARRILRKGDVIMSTVRPNLLGYGFADFEASEFICSTGFAIISPKEISNGQFIYQNLYSENVQSQINKLIVGSNYPAINSSDVQNIKIPFPPLLEQEKIASILSSVDEKLEVLVEKKTHYQELKQGLMQQLLTGKIRVNGLINKPTMA